MSELRVDSVKSKGGGAPDLPKGVTISGIATAATLGATTVDVSNVNVSGVVTSATLNGPLLSTGTPTLGLGVTINSSGLVVSGVATAGIVSATTLYGDGTNITGLGATLAPLFYNPDVSDSLVTFGTGIGITFNQQIKAGTGNITIRETNASGTVVENFGVGSSVTISENRVSFTPTSDLGEDTIYHISYPSGAFTNNAGDVSYVGTAYTFKTLAYTRNLYTWGRNLQGELGHNAQGSAPTYPNSKSSPTQVPGTTWKNICNAGNGVLAAKSDGTLWAWGQQRTGEMGINEASSPTYAKWSSPVQIGSDTDWSTTNRTIAASWALPTGNSAAIKTDGTLWTWGDPEYGTLGQNTTSGAGISAPIQLGSGTDWSKVTVGGHQAGAVKTDGTLYMWGNNQQGQLGQNSLVQQSSPVQVPGTTWNDITMYTYTLYGSTFATKTDGTLWSWGYNNQGQLGLNDQTWYSSPVQIPGTTWTLEGFENNGWNKSNASFAAMKTDGSLWVWGYSDQGNLGIPDNIAWGKRSSPIQIPGTWNKVTCFGYSMAATKTDGTLWAWGANAVGQLGQNEGPSDKYSSPIQIGSESDWTRVSGGENSCAAIRRS